MKTFDLRKQKHKNLRFQEEQVYTTAHQILSYWVFKNKQRFDMIFS